MDLGVNKIFVAMSGGVDSSVAAGLLLEQGYDIEGVTMCFELPASGEGRRPEQPDGERSELAATWRPQSGRPSCCGLESIEDARRVAKALGIPHHVLNYGDALEAAVINDFINEYLLGRTPNPCVRCNQHLKFVRLFNDVKVLGATHLATGHYARVLNDPIHGWCMKKGLDARKDQSYFLYGIPRTTLPQVLFPLGGLTKDEVRAHARRMNLPTAAKKESQDICFIPDGDYRSFLKVRAPSLSVPGDMIDHTGKKVGRHQGVSHFTIGQREGLGVALGYPAFVYCIDTASNIVYVGPRERLSARGLLASGLNLVSMNFSKDSIEAGVKIRYNHYDINARVDIIDESRISVRFREVQGAVTPGQSVVFYQGEMLLGGALIDAPLFDDGEISGG
ncbi:MAG: tRNA 2-thiouridine(34) synthase MnmA [Candidatus Omnitrophica bacterium]|nr:tRNA 2-thiouridine(34) synthase MnmA [Candidatus Omnitrophota bacterium]